eukprot:g61033.t1
MNRPPPTSPNWHDGTGTGFAGYGGQMQYQQYQQPGSPGLMTGGELQPGEGQGPEGQPNQPGAMYQGQGADLKQIQLNKLRKIAEQYELHGGAVNALRALEGYDIVILCDDSGSMNTPVAGGGQASGDPFAQRSTRWHELKSRVVQILRIAVALDEDGIDIYFLNRDGAKNVTDERQVEALFKEPPKGYTPLREAWTRMMKDYARSEKRLLTIIATDGEPNVMDEKGTLRVDSPQFAQVLKARNRPAFFPVVIMACTDNDDEIAWLNGLDDKCPNCDVVDDYLTERKDILKVQGEAFKFSQGDYVVKTLLGSINPIYDNLDERKLNRKEKALYYGIPESQVKDTAEKGECNVQ